MLDRQHVRNRRLERRLRGAAPYGDTKLMGRAAQFGIHRQLMIPFRWHAYLEVVVSLEYGLAECTISKNECHKLARGAAT